MNLPLRPSPPPHPMLSRFPEDLRHIIANSHRHSHYTLFWCSRIHNCHCTDIYSSCQSCIFPLIRATANLKTSDIPCWLKVSHLPLIDEKKKKKLCSRVPRDQSGWDLTYAERWLNELVSRPSSTSQLPAHGGGGLDSLHAEVKVMFPSQSLWRTRRKSSSQTVNFNEYKAA